MDPPEKLVLRRKKTILASHFNLTVDHLNRFKEAKLLKKTDYDFIKGEPTNVGRVGRLVDGLPAEGFEFLCDLLEQENEWLSEELKAEMKAELGQLEIEEYISKEASVLVHREFGASKRLAEGDKAKLCALLAARTQFAKEVWKSQLLRTAEALQETREENSEKDTRAELLIKKINTFLKSNRHRLERTRPPNSKTNQAEQQRQSDNKTSQPEPEGRSTWRTGQVEEESQALNKASEAEEKKSSSRRSSQAEPQRKQSSGASDGQLEGADGKSNGRRTGSGNRVSFNLDETVITASPAPETTPSVQDKIGTDKEPQTSPPEGQRSKENQPEVDGNDPVSEKDGDEKVVMDDETRKNFDILHGLIDELLELSDGCATEKEMLRVERLRLLEALLVKPEEGELVQMDVRLKELLEKAQQALDETTEKIKQREKQNKELEKQIQEVWLESEKAIEGKDETITNTNKQLKELQEKNRDLHLNCMKLEAETRTAQSELKQYKLKTASLERSRRLGYKPAETNRHSPGSRFPAIQS